MVYRTLNQDVALLFEADESLLPLLPEVFAGLETLGGSTDTLLNLVTAHGPPDENQHILDLGCGKGAHALMLAQRFGCEVTGVDGLLPFVAQAKSTATRQNLNHLCHFHQRNLRDDLAAAETYDGLIFSCMGDLLGPPEQTVAALRKLVTPGGWLFIEDAYGKKQAASVPGSGTLLTREYMQRAMTTHGDKLLGEESLSEADMQKTSRGNAQTIARNITSMTDTYPQQADTLAAYGKCLAGAAAFVAQHFICAAWLVEVTGD